MHHQVGKVSKEQWGSIYKPLGPDGAFRRFAGYRIDKYSARNYRLSLLFNRFLAQGNMKLLDIGCGTGKWLTYFSREFGYEVYGVDYSKSACDVTKETLRRNRVPGTVLCDDLFDTSFQNRYKDYFDVVMSMGVVEHFDNPTIVVDAHLNLLRNSGHIIITIPNFGDGSLYRMIEKMRGREKEILEEHNVALMQIPNLRKCFREDIEILMIDYIGGISILRAIDPTAWPRWSRAIHLPYILDQITSYATFCLKSSVLSPTIALIGQKIK